MTRAVYLVLAACGSAATGPAGTSHTAGPPSPAPAASGAGGRAHLCERSAALAAAKCSPFGGMEKTSLLTDCSVADSLYIAGAQACVDATSCDAVQACLVAAAQSDAPYAGPTIACVLAPGTESTIPAGVGARELAASYGRADRTFADSPSSAARPIEVCGMPAETAYLTRLTCADGTTRPFSDRSEAADARKGNAGAGGRCGRIVDAYAVTCPEKLYTVFIDPYRCPARSSSR